MNRERAKELLPIIQAFAEGKAIEYRYKDGKWKSPTISPLFEDLSFNDDIEYRIKPEPEVIYVNKWFDGSNVAYKTKREAETSVYINKYKYIAKKFIEVIDD